MNTLVKKKRSEKIQKNSFAPFWGIDDFLPNFNFAAIFGHFFIIKSAKSKNISGYGLYKYIGKEKRVKKNYRKNGITPFGPHSTDFFEFSISYNSETTPPRVQILPSMDFFRVELP